MWSPTHVRVTVCRAKNLKIKGKAGKNDAYVTIKLCNELYQTSVRERTTQPEWLEQCDFALGGKSSVVKLKVYHRNFVGRDDFLGQVSIDIQEFKVHERPRSRWYALLNKPGSKGPGKYRGELELLVSFHVHSMSTSQLTLSRSAGKTSLKERMASQLTGGKLKHAGRFGLRSSSKLDLSSNSDVARLRSSRNLPLSFNNSQLRQDDQDDDDSVKEMPENHDSDTTDDEDDITDDYKTSLSGAEKSTNSGPLTSGVLSQSPVEITSIRECEVSPVNAAISPLNEEGDSAPVDGDQQNSETRQDDVTADDTDAGVFTYDDVMQSVKENGESKEPSSPARLPTYPVSQFESVDMSTPRPGGDEDDDSELRQRRTPSLDDLSSTSSGAELPCGATAFDMTPGQLGDAFIGDLQCDERQQSVQVAVLQSSSSSSLSSHTDQRKNTHAQLPQSPVRASWELFGEVQVNTTSADDSDQQKTYQSFTEAPPVTAYNNEDAVRPKQLAEQHRPQMETYSVEKIQRQLTKDEQTQTSASTSSSVVERPWSPSQAAVLRDYMDCSREELLQKLIQQRHQLRQRDAHIADLERYIDELVVKVIDLQPLLLSHDTPPPARPTTSQSTSQPRVSQHQSTTGRHASPFIRQTAPQKIERSRSGLKKFAIGPLQTLLK